MKNKIKIIYEDKEFENFSEKELLNEIKNLNQYELDFIFYAFFQILGIENNLI